MARDLKSLFNLEVVFQPSAARLELNGTTSALLFRCAEELLVNVARHSGAGCAEVLVRRSDGTVELIVRDEGRGFSPSEVEGEHVKGFGLSSMRERLTYSGGTMVIESVPGETTITVSVPLS